MSHVATRQELTGREQLFGEDEIIVSKTDLQGRITYANRVFLRVAHMSEGEALGAPHNVIRHPHMPACVFQLLWEVIASGEEIFAYVLNRCVDGDHYWVLAHVTPTFDDDGEIIGYHSNRRCPRREAVDAIAPLYARLLEIEQQASSRQAGIQAARAALETTLAETGVTYSQFVFSL